MIRSLLARASTWWLVFAVALVARTLHRPESHTVFPILAAGAQHWWDDEPLYADYKPLDDFRYPPTLAVALTPFMLCGPRVGGVLWSLVGLGVYWIGLRRFEADVLTRETPTRRTLFLIAALLGGIAGFWNGQSNGLLVGLLLIGISSIVRERRWTAALMLSLPVVLKLTPLPVVMLLCAVRPRALIGRVVLLVSLGLFVPFLTRPPEIVVEQYRGLIDHLQETSSRRWKGFRDGWTVHVVISHRLQGREGLPDLERPFDSDWYRVVQVSAGAVVFLWCLHLRRRGTATPVLTAATAAGGATWLLLLGPASEPPTYVFIAPFLAWGLAARATGYRPFIYLASLLLLVLGWSALTRPLWEAIPLLFLSLPLGLVAFACWLASLEIRLDNSRIEGTMSSNFDVPIRDDLPCLPASSSCPPPSARAICAPPRRSKPPCDRPVPTAMSETSTS